MQKMLRVKALDLLGNTQKSQIEKIRENVYAKKNSTIDHP